MIPWDDFKIPQDAYAWAQENAKHFHWAPIFFQRRGRLYIKTRVLYYRKAVAGMLP